MVKGQRILYRQIVEVPAGNWKQFLEHEDRMDEAEIQRGYPLPRKYRQLFGSGHSDCVRVYERLFESYAAFGKLIELRRNDPVLTELDNERHRLSCFESTTYYCVDSGCPVYPLMWQMSKIPFTEEELACACDEYDSTPSSREEVESNIAAGKLRILHRRVQMIPMDRWAEQLRQERACDKAEAAMGIPLPMRYRTGPGTNYTSYMRVTQREFASIEDAFSVLDSFIHETDAGYREMMDQEINRNNIVDWEQEEIYIVDSDSFTPMWMSYAAMQE